MNDRTLRGCDLHLHILGAFYSEDVLALGRDRYREVNWDEWGYLDDYQKAFGVRPYPIAVFERAVAELNGVSHVQNLHVFTEEDGGDFGRWEAKFKFFTSIWTHYRSMGEEGDLRLLRRMLERHRAQGLDYVEFRIGSGLDGFQYWHGLCAQTLREASEGEFVAKYILSFPRNGAFEHYAELQRLFDERPEFIDTIVGIDFAGQEEGMPPKHLRTFMSQVVEDNERHPGRAVDVVYHVGESFFDKSLESAVRWCHEVAEMRVRRVGHAIALGLDPEVAVSRRPGAHERESVSERIDQIEYDLRYAKELEAYGIREDHEALGEEKDNLQTLEPDETVRRTYDAQRLEGIRKRQRLVLDRLTELGTVIECCPTSNLRIGGITRPGDHPIGRFLDTDVSIVICSDDPGNLETSVSREVDWVLGVTGKSESDLVERLGNPREFRLAAHRM